MSDASRQTKNDLTIYDDAADQWWSGEVRWVRTLHNMVAGRLNYFDRLVDWQGKAVLDLGCAGGFMAEALTRRGARVTGLDPAEKAIAAARDHAAERGLDIRYDIGVGEDMPYDDDSFDVVVSVDVLEHVTDLDQVLVQVARVLRPGGLFLYDTINRNPLSRLVVVDLAERVFGLLPQGTHDPDMFIKPGELSASLSRQGFEVGPMTGLGPHRFDSSGDFVFGRLPTTAIVYMGSARLEGGAHG